MSGAVATIHAGTQLYEAQASSNIWYCTANVSGTNCIDGLCSTREPHVLILPDGRDTFRMTETSHMHQRELNI